jgi:putative transposase
VRRLRSWFPGAKYHITSRGIRKYPLFYEDEDYHKYLSIIKETLQTHPFNLQSYCLMTNNTHLQIETIEAPPSMIMKKINTTYAKYFNWKYEYSGHVFDKCYGAELIDSPDHEKDVSKYIHLNPFKAGMVESPEEYPWSSYHTYLYGEDSPFITTKQILLYFPNSLFQSYDDFVRAPFSNSTFPADMEDGLCGQRLQVLG